MLCKRTNENHSQHYSPVVLGLMGGEESLGHLHRQCELGASADQHEGRVGQTVLRAAGPLLRGVAAQRSLLVARA